MEAIAHWVTALRIQVLYHFLDLLKIAKTAHYDLKKFLWTVFLAFALLF